MQSYGITYPLISFHVNKLQKNAFLSNIPISGVYGMFPLRYSDYQCVRLCQSSAMRAVSRDTPKASETSGGRTSPSFYMIAQCFAMLPTHSTTLSLSARVGLTRWVMHRLFAAPVHERAEQEWLPRREEEKSFLFEAFLCYISCQVFCLIISSSFNNAGLPYLK